MAHTPERVFRLETISVLKIVLILLGMYVLYLIRDIVALVFMALFLSLLMTPIATKLQKYRIPRGVTVIIFYVFLFGLASVSLGLLVPAILDQSTLLANAIGSSWNALSSSVHTLQDLTTRYGLADNVQAGVDTLQGQITRAATGVFSTVADTVGGLASMIIVLVMAFYMTTQEEEARTIFHEYVPDAYKGLSSTIIKRVIEKMSKWLVGQISLCLIIGVCYWIGLSIVGVHSSLLLALFGGFTEFIPYLGPILGAIPAVLIGFTQSPLHAVLALAVVIVIQQLEGHIIVPKVMEKAVGLNPLISIVALLVGFQLFGFMGALLAIPVATAITVVLGELYRFDRKP